MVGGQAVDQDGLSGLSMFSFDDLLAEASEARERSKSKKDSWNQLTEVISDLRGATDSDFDAVGGPAWSLRRIEVVGYRGIGNDEPLIVDLDPTPGMTVLHGPNGSGKSSIADAVTASLTGEAPGASEAKGRGGQRPIWDPVPVAARSTGTRATLHLAREDEELIISCRLDSEGSVSEHTFQRVVDGKPTQVELGADWFAALESYQPVFAYATWERRIQLSKHLQEFFEGLLALGGCFTAVQSRVAELGAAAKQANSAWTDSLKAAQESVAEVDQRRRAEEAENLGAIEWPQIEDDIESWVGQQGLNAGAVLDIEITSADRDELAAAARSFQEAAEEHARTVKTREEHLRTHLEALHREGLKLDDPGGDCPVCRTDDVAWLDELNSTLVALQETPNKAVRGTLDAAVARLHGMAQRLAPRLEALEPEVAAARGQALSDLRRLAQVFVGACHDHGVRAASSEVEDAASKFGRLALADAVVQLLDHLIEQTDRLQRWQAERTEACQEFISAWRTHQTLGATQDRWHETAKRLDDLRTRLRDQRVRALQERSNRTIQSLLEDVQLRVDELVVQKTKADLRLAQSGEDFELGMLSAGQRNAVLLAPLLAAAEGGPFEFLFLDDPVHAFDELRVDRLAADLADLATRRRVIVLTHDERLYEFLAARVPDLDARTVDRSIESSEVTISQRGPIWQQLLDDAELLLGESVAVDEVSLSLGDTVRGLCRQALDNALRSFVLQRAPNPLAELRAGLAKLDDAMTTRDRLKVAKRLVEGDTTAVRQVETAQRMCGDRLDDWNRAAHASQSKRPAGIEDVDVARQACDVLGGLAS